MPNHVKPTPIALVVCDNIYSEPGGKTALVGLFSGITASSFPARHPRMAVFASLTGLRSDAKAKLEIVHAETDDVIVSAEGPFPGGHTPLTVVDINFIFNNVVFPSEGTHYIRFWANEHLIVMRPFEVRQAKKPGANKNAKDSG